MENIARTIDVDNPTVDDKVKAVYSFYCKGEIVVTDIQVAEIGKVIVYTFRDIILHLLTSLLNYSG